VDLFSKIYDPRDVGKILSNPVPICGQKHRYHDVAADRVTWGLWTLGSCPIGI
jgi:hypothetical protein